MGSIFRISIRIMLVFVYRRDTKRVEKIMNKTGRRKESKIKGEIGTYTESTRYTAIVYVFK